MKCLITGGAGFVGSYLTEKLVELGHLVTIIDNLSTGKLNDINHIRFEAFQQKTSRTQ